VPELESNSTIVANGSPPGAGGRISAPAGASPVSSGVFLGPGGDPNEKFNIKAFQKKIAEDREKQNSGAKGGESRSGSSGSQEKGSGSSPTTGKDQPTTSSVGRGPPPGRAELEKRIKNGNEVPEPQVWGAVVNPRKELYVGPAYETTGIHSVKDAKDPTKNYEPSATIHPSLYELITAFYLVAQNPHSSERTQEGKRITELITQLDGKDKQSAMSSLVKEFTVRAGKATPRDVDPAWVLEGLRELRILATATTVPGRETVPGSTKARTELLATLLQLIEKKYDGGKSLGIVSKGNINYDKVAQLIGGTEIGKGQYYTTDVLSGNPRDTHELEPVDPETAPQVSKTPEVQQKSEKILDAKKTVDEPGNVVAVLNPFNWAKGLDLLGFIDARKKYTEAPTSIAELYRNKTDPKDSKTTALLFAATLKDGVDKLLDASPKGKGHPLRTAKFDLDDPKSLEGYVKLFHESVRISASGDLVVIVDPNTKDPVAIRTLHNGFSAIGHKLAGAATELPVVGWAADALLNSKTWNHGLKGSIDKGTPLLELAYKPGEFSLIARQALLALNGGQGRYGFAGGGQDALQVPNYVMQKTVKEAEKNGGIANRTIYQGTHEISYKPQKIGIKVPKPPDQTAQN
jgi:hypothetical protein